MNRKAGTRVYLKLVHETTGEQKERWGTVDKDEGLWDYTDVRFDDMPAFVSPILSYYLFSEDDGKNDLTL